MIASLMLAPVASANGPNSAQVGPAHPITIQYDPAWLAAKNSYRVISGIKPNQGKHGKANPTILSTPLIDLSSQNSYMASRTIGYAYPPVSGEPLAYTLPYSGTGVQWAAEPSDGTHPNWPNGPHYDDAQHTYNDYWWVTMCAPGAADVALFYWPAPANYSNHSVVDTLPGAPSTTVTWNGQDPYDSTYRMRGYMAYLGFGISNVPGWGGRKGMLPESYYQTGILGGSTLQATQQMMNWEASGENSSTWTNYFYVVTWNNSVTNIGVTLHNDIVSDNASSKVPVVVEVNAKYLPDWNTTNNVNHFIAILGYDDNQDRYYYIDTCKIYTGCHGSGGSQGDTPDLHYISQEQLTTAVSAISTNQATGDGGWVW